MAQKKQIHLGLWLTYVDGLRWRDPDSRAEEINSLEPYAELARLAEEAKFDAVFRGDGVGQHPIHRSDVPAGGSLEILTLLAALAGRTSRIGLIGTASTSFTEPYNLARVFATLDHLSGGRAGWNIVTSSGGERNFGIDSIPTQDERYARADEYLEVVKKLWNSWSPDSLPIDKESGVFVRPDEVRSIDHVGTHFRVADALNVSRSPQGHPVLVQAGNSDRGQAFAAEHAEVVFTAQTELVKSQRFVRRLRERIRAAGRDAEKVKILPALGLHLAETEREVEDRRRAFIDAIDYDAARRSLEALIGDIDLSGIDLDDQVPDELWPDTRTLTRRQSRPQIFIDLSRERGYTLRRVLQELATGYGHGTLFGTPEQAADRIEAWTSSGAADGFVISAWSGLASVELIAKKLVPILQERGIFRSDYTGNTLREHLGLEHPDA